MGNEQPKKVGKINKNQIQITSLKAKIHLELMRDRKNAEIIKGEKQLLKKLKSPSRNKSEEILIAERVVNGLKYSQAANQLMAYAASLKSQSSFITENLHNHEKIEPWLGHIYSLLYAADHLGLSSLNEFKSVMRSLNDPESVKKYVNPEIIELLSPSPTPYEMNIYFVEMGERNNISIEEINMAGHKFEKNPEPPLRESAHKFNDIEKQLAEEFKKNLGPNDANNSFGEGGQGGQGGFGQGGQGGFGQGGFGEGQGGYGQGGYGQGSFGGQGGFGGNQGYNNQPQYSNPPPQYNNPPQQYNNPPPEQYNNPPSENPYGSNPYKGASSLNHGPQYYQPSQINNQQIDKPKQFSSYDNMMGTNKPQNPNPIYPSVDPNAFTSPQYQPTKPEQSQQPQQPPSEINKSPTISQIMRDFK